MGHFEGCRTFEACAGLLLVKGLLEAVAVGGAVGVGGDKAPLLGVGEGGLELVVADSVPGGSDLGAEGALAPDFAAGVGERHTQGFDVGDPLEVLGGGVVVAFDVAAKFD